VEKSYDGEYQDQDDFPVDQYNYILNARTTSLAEIPTLRVGIDRLSGLLEELEDIMPDPDDDLKLRPEIEKFLSESDKLSKDSRLNPEKMREKLDC